jgi:hypothetical protein
MNGLVPLGVCLDCGAATTLRGGRCKLCQKSKTTKPHCYLHTRLKLGVEVHRSQHGKGLFASEKMHPDTNLETTVVQSLGTNGDGITQTEILVDPEQPQKRGFDPDDVICTYDGELKEKDEKPSDYDVERRDGRVIDASNPATSTVGRYANDGEKGGSEEAVNAVINRDPHTNACCLIATKRIPPGHEVLVSYGQDWWDKKAEGADDVVEEMVGKGSEGKVFQAGNGLVVKVFFSNPKGMAGYPRQSEFLSINRDTGLVPIVHEEGVFPLEHHRFAGRYYIVMTDLAAEGYRSLAHHFPGRRVPPDDIRQLILNAAKQLLPRDKIWYDLMKKGNIAWNPDTRGVKFYEGGLPNGRLPYNAGVNELRV